MVCVCTSKVAVIFIRGGGTHHPNTECFATAQREVKAESWIRIHHGRWAGFKEHWHSCTYYNVCILATCTSICYIVQICTQTT